MAWARLDDMLPIHPKVRALSDAAFRLYISAICWSNANLTDGRIPSGQLRYLSDVRSPSRCAEHLVNAGLWEANGDGWLIHDYLDYQPAADKVRQDREAKKQRQERWKANRDASHAAPGDASRDAPPIPSHPIPSPERSLGNQLSAHNGRAPNRTLIEETRQAILDRTGKSVTDEQAQAVADQIIGTETVRNRVAYVTVAIQRDPNPRRFLPTPTPPRLVSQRPPPDQHEINERGRAAAKAALQAAREASTA